MVHYIHIKRGGRVKGIGMQKIIEVRNASFRYPDADAQAVDQFSMDVYKGEFLAVLGHNGSGKSTMAKLLNALLITTGGEVLVGGINAAAPGAQWDVRAKCGMVFQNPDNQLVATVVEEDVAFGLENLGVVPEEIRKRVQEALAMVGMSEFAHRAPHMLSGGQKQRVAIAGVLAMRPEVIVFDEATAMLDPAGRRDVLEVVRKLNREEGVTVVWITHFMQEAAIADRIVVMDNGTNALDGTPKAVFAQVDQVRALRLDVPPMAELSGELRAGGLALPDGILTVEEMVDALCQLR